MKLVMLFMPALVACAPAVRTQTTLAVVDAAYGTAMSACVTREGSIVAAARAGHMTPAAALVEFDAVSQRCYRTRAAFEVVLTLIEDGRLDEAEAALAKLRGAP